MESNSSMRRKDRELSRKTQFHLYENNYKNNFSEELFIQFENAITGKSKETIDISKYTTSQLISTEYAINIKLFEPLLNKSNQNKFSKYSIKFNNCLLTITPKPSHAHLGNCLIESSQFIHGLCLKDGSFKYSDIYKFLINLCGREVKSEIFKIKRRAVAAMMLEFIQKGPQFYCNVIDKENEKYKVKLLQTSYAYDDSFDHEFSVTLSDNQNVNLTINDLELSKFMGICYIFCIREATRHMASPSYYGKNSNHYGKNLPFCIANFRALKLLEKGELSFNNLFSEDAEYGVSTGQNITIFGEEKLKKTKNKFCKVNKKYNLSFFIDVENSQEFFNEFKKDFSLPNNIDDNSSEQDSDQDCWSDDDSEGRPKRN